MGSLMKFSDKTISRNNDKWAKSERGGIKSIKSRTQKVWSYRYLNTYMYVQTERGEGVKMNGSLT